MKSFRLTTLLLLLIAIQAQSQTASERTLYQPEQTISGKIRIWGDDQMEALVGAWERGFEKYHRQATFETKLMGTGTAMAGLYSGVADLAFMGRASTPKEIMAFEWVFKYKPLEIEIATGSLNEPGKSPALVVFTHRRNPISRLSLNQLEAIFGCNNEQPFGAIATWGRFGLAGEWTDRVIHAYGYDTETGPALFFRQAVLKGCTKWGWEHLTEFKDGKRPDGSIYKAAQQILDTLATDRYGIAVSSMAYVNPQVKPVALGLEIGGPYYEATKETLTAGKYPLTRLVYAYVNRAPSRALDPIVKEFLHYILSRQGQNDVLHDGGYLPLSESAVDNQLKKLNESIR